MTTQREIYKVIFTSHAASNPVVLFEGTDFEKAEQIYNNSSFADFFPDQLHSIKDNNSGDYSEIQLQKFIDEELVDINGEWMIKTYGE